ncbi:MAG: hypothetical protein H0U71_01740 [Gammaproteobacteria bacterium]|nr:hypothetical protein [Gammaproteobacteria bacterium]
MQLLKQFYILIIFFNVVAWGVALLFSSNEFVQLGFCVVAYTLGLRHAFDADHISTIDNLTRKLIEERKNPQMVGFFFSLGHSTVVIILSLLVAILSEKVFSNFEIFKKVGSIIGGGFSVFFLSLISLLNIYLFFQVIKRIYLLKKNKVILTQSHSLAISNSFTNKLFRYINKNYQIYFVGFIFGLGFDTATEIALLGMSSSQTIYGIHWWYILILPILFTSGMCLVDTTVSLLSLITCRYAVINHKVGGYFNLFITLFISFTGLGIATCEFFHVSTLGKNKLPQLWNSVELVINHFGEVGIFITFVLLISWMSMKYLVRSV